MPPLLTPSQAYAIQSFLEHIDLSGTLDGISAGEPAAEWPAIYTGGAGSEASGDLSSSLHHDLHSVGTAGTGTNSNSDNDNEHINVLSNNVSSNPYRLPRIAPREPDGIANEDMPPPADSGNEKLAKAAKDLMSLDSNPLKWTDSADHDLPCPPPPPRLIPHQHHGGGPRHSASPVHIQHHTRASHQGHARSNSALSHAHFANGASGSRPRLAALAGISQSGDGLSAYDSLPSGSSVNSSDTSPPPLTPPSSTSISKRPYDTILDPSCSSSSIASSAYGIALPPFPKKARASSSSSSHLQQQQPHPASSSTSIGTINAKPTLLSASQKKANHIQSEQKRRANIRRGYEALCDTVPALQEAIRREEEEQRMLSQSTSAAAAGGESAGKVKKKLRARRKVADSGERIDGRAGPRSENIVLSKTIDYIHDLLSEKAAWLDRLARARTTLMRSSSNTNAPPPLSLLPTSVDPATGVPLWDREWGGGVGLLEPEGDADAEGGGGMGGSDDEGDD